MRSNKDTDFRLLQLYIQFPFQINKMTPASLSACLGVKETFMVQVPWVVEHSIHYWYNQYYSIGSIRVGTGLKLQFKSK